ncbi:uncharacterized protein LOC119085603 isoform X2 [Bradysia coprophila]|uniref:uncharacterized protein LOC119085603 isoform X2 n=1 Tax=Bradysia coprophila TaxID=38358 RepID=UPI00187DD826|nr:uncharacterized protein LOC119085603 isoform X2 [Bradysia coprophila]
MSAKDLEAETIQPVEFDTEDLMVKDFNDPHLNCYDEGPGSNLQDECALPNQTNRSDCGVILRFVPSILGDKGIKNLCNKYGQVKEVQNKWMNYERTGENVVVKIASVADAESVIHNINNLCLKVGGKVMKASFYKQKQQYKPRLDDSNEESPEVDEAMKGRKFERAEIVNEFHLPLAIPSPLPEPNEVDNQRMKILLEGGQHFPTITNGSVIYRHSPNSIAMMEKFSSNSMGSFDEEMQHFVHNATNDLTVPEQCKNCQSPTVKFCKGCKDSFCSIYCLKEYNSNECGCSCVSSTPEAIVNRRANRHSAGRGAKLLSPRVLAPRSSSISSTDSDTKSTGSGTQKKRAAFLRACLDQQNIESVIQVKPCDLPKNNKLVVITNVLSHKIVFLRSFEPNDNERYVKYLNDVAEYAKTAPALAEMPKTGDIVLAYYEGFYYRASIAGIEDGKAIVNLLELGNVVTTPVDKMKNLSQDLQNVQRFVFKASLSGLERQTMKTDKCLTYLYELLERRAPLKFISKAIGSSSRVVECELIVSETNERVNGKLTTLNSIKASECVMIHEIPIKPFDGNATEAVVIDNSLALKGILTVATPAHMSDMFNMHERIQEYCKAEYKSPYSPRVNEICLAKCNEQWYRAKIDKSFADMNPVMLFIDFALFNKVHVDNMRRMPSDFKFPLYSVMAEIGDITDTTDLNKLAEIFPCMSTVSVAKVEFVNGNTDEPTIYFNIPGGLPEEEVVQEVAEKVATPTVFQPRRKLLESLRKKFCTQAENSK